MTQRDQELRYWRGLGEHMRRERDEMALVLERAERRSVEVGWDAAGREAIKRLKAARIAREADGIGTAVGHWFGPSAEPVLTELDRPVRLPDYRNDTVAKRMIRHFRKSRKRAGAEHHR